MSNRRYYIDHAVFGSMLGVILGIAGIYVTDWRFWLITLYATAGFILAYGRGSDASQHHA